MAPLKTRIHDKLLVHVFKSYLGTEVSGTESVTGLPRLTQQKALKVGVGRAKGTAVRGSVAETWGPGARKVKVRVGCRAGTRLHRGLQTAVSNWNFIRRAIT